MVRSNVIVNTTPSEKTITEGWHPLTVFQDVVGGHTPPVRTVRTPEVSPTVRSSGVAQHTPSKKTIGAQMITITVFPNGVRNATKAAAIRRSYSCSSSASHKRLTASLGMRRSPRGLTDTLPTLGPSGRQLSLNSCAKKRR